MEGQTTDLRPERPLLIRARRQLWLLALAAATCVAPAAFANDPSAAGARENAPALLPLPATLQLQGGRYRLGAQPRIALRGDSAALQPLGELAGTLLESTWQQRVQIAPAVSQARHADLTLALSADAKANPESYALRIDEAGIHLQAPSARGLFYGLQTLRQLLEQSSAADGLPHLAIQDAPRFGWRGLHLDVGRHVFPMAYIKKQLDLMARYKFNTLHWHLTDDQGWRLQSDRYPRLTEVGAWRKQTPIYSRTGETRYDGKRYGGFYTQAQAREIVDYARKLHITVVPEIEMPGHAVAALAAYPELACTPGPFQVRVDWGVDDNVFCPSEQTFAFIEGMLDEVLAIFPSEYIHVGGDEAPTVRWEQSALAQDIIRREGLKDEHALQGWFMRRVEAYLQQHGRRMLAWDEMLAGDPARSTTIMAWRGVDEGIKAARRGHDVVMTPVSYAYFDYCQSVSSDEPYCPGQLPISQVYAFDPVPEALTPAQARHVVGGQANLWTEHIRTAEHAEYMLWPRALAMSEVLWTPQAARQWRAFEQRLAPQFAALGRLDVNFRIPEVQGIHGDVLSLQPQARVALAAPLADAAIVYTLDGSTPGAGSATYRTPLALALGEAPVTLAARLRLADGRLGPVTRASYARTTLQPARTTDAALQPGLRRDYFEAQVSSTDALLKATPLRSDVATAIGIPADARKDRFGLRYRGWIQVPADAVYRFTLGSDDGARLYVDDALVVDRDGPQSPGGSVGSIALAKGLHRFELRYFQGGGDKQLQLQVARDGAAPASVPDAWLRH
jgi:hexosaminidase